SQAELRSRVEKLPGYQQTEFGNYNYTAKVVSRSAGSTYVVTDDPDSTQVQSITRAEYDRVAALQDQHIAEREMILIEGYIGPENSPMRVASRLYVDAAKPNIPAMQEQLFYPKDASWSADEAFTVIYTPELPVEGYPSDRLIAIDLDNW